MGAEQENHGAWDRVRAIAERLESPHADKVFVAKDYTKADLRRDLLASIPSRGVAERVFDEDSIKTAECVRDGEDGR